MATLRNARGGAHPDPVRAARLAIEAGADGITAHLREDRRHIRDDDIARLKAEIDQPLNFEMAATEEMVAIALRTRPHAACLVPERRRSAPPKAASTSRASTTGWRRSSPSWRRPASGCRCSSRPSRGQIEAAAHLRAPVIEIHTGAWCEALAEGDRGGGRRRNGSASSTGASSAQALGLEVHAGHGLDYASAETIAALPQIVELNIGHFLIGEAVFAGLAEAIAAMRAAMDRGRAKAGDGAHDHRHRLRHHPTSAASRR